VCKAPSPSIHNTTGSGQLQRTHNPSGSCQSQHAAGTRFVQRAGLWGACALAGLVTACRSRSDLPAPACMQQAACMHAHAPPSRAGACRGAAGARRGARTCDVTSVTVTAAMLADATARPCARRLAASSPSAAVASSTLATVSEKRAVVAIATCRGHARVRVRAQGACGAAHPRRLHRRPVLPRLRARRRAAARQRQACAARELAGRARGAGGRAGAPPAR